MVELKVKVSMLLMRVMSNSNLTARKFPPKVKSSTQAMQVTKDKMLRETHPVPSELSCGTSG